jgi:hypothetical protein
LKYFSVRKISNLITECKQIKKFVNIFFQKITFFLQMRLFLKIGFMNAHDFFRAHFPISIFFQVQDKYFHVTRTLRSHADKRVRMIAGKI